MWFVLFTGLNASAPLFTGGSATFDGLSTVYVTTMPNYPSSCTHTYINSSDEHVYSFADSDDDSDDDVPDLMDPDDSDIYDDMPDLELHQGNLEVPVAPAA